MKRRGQIFFPFFYPFIERKGDKLFLVWVLLVLVLVIVIAINISRTRDSLYKYIFYRKTLLEPVWGF